MKFIQLSVMHWIKLSLSICKALRVRRKCNSSSTSLLEHLGHVLLCRGKSNFGCEKYLSVINNIEIRKHFTRLWLSAHSLRIEKGRHQGIPRHNRTCPRCSKAKYHEGLFECDRILDSSEASCKTICFRCLWQYMNLLSFAFYCLRIFVYCMFVCIIVCIFLY
jgi:hypothetical protein